MVNIGNLSKAALSVDNEREMVLNKLRVIFISLFNLEHRTNCSVNERSCINEKMRDIRSSSEKFQAGIVEGHRLLHIYNILEL